MSYKAGSIILASLVLVIAALAALPGCDSGADASGSDAPVTLPPGTGSVIFIHPDGTGANYWSAARAFLVGPDNDLHWDRLPAIALYRGHIKNALTATSNAGGTIHAYGVKVSEGSFGNDNGEPITSASGQPVSIMREARAKGIAVGVVNSAAFVDAGTGAFLATVRDRRLKNEIARQMLEADPHVMLGGGEQWFLPIGVTGRHGEEGKRTDGLNLVAEAIKKGYTVVYTREELAAVPESTTKLLGLFAADDTFNDATEEALAASGKPLYQPQAPPLREMVRAAVTVLARNPRGFFLVAEEEGTDNFANDNNASGSFEALRRADDAIGWAREFVDKNPRTLLLVAADSDSGGMQVLSNPLPPSELDKPLPATDDNGAPYDGPDGTRSRPFLSQPDRAGKRHPFAISWATSDDAMGAVLVRAAGLNSDQVRGSFDSTRIYALMYRTLFGTDPAHTAR